MTAKRWRVNDGHAGRRRRQDATPAATTFDATDGELDEHGSRPYVTEVRQQAAPKAVNKAVPAPKPNPVKRDGKADR